MRDEDQARMHDGIAASLRARAKMEPDRAEHLLGAASAHEEKAAAYRGEPADHPGAKAAAEKWATPNMPGVVVDLKATRPLTEAGKAASWGVNQQATGTDDRLRDAKGRFARKT